MDIYDKDKVWGYAKLSDPQPVLAKHMTDDYEAGDYVLIKGQDVEKASKGKRVVFGPGEELVLRSDFQRIEEDMDTEDLIALGSDTFLLWWQCIKPPKVVIPRKPKAGKLKGAPRSRRGS